MVGDGGNVEGIYKEHIDTIKPQPTYCKSEARLHNNASIGCFCGLEIGGGGRRLGFVCFEGLGF